MVESFAKRYGGADRDLRSKIEMVYGGIEGETEEFQAIFDGKIETALEPEVPPLLDIVSP